MSCLSQMALAGKYLIAGDCNGEPLILDITNENHPIEIKQ